MPENNPEKTNKEIKMGDIPMRSPVPVPSIYCNNASINGTNWDDVRFIFGEVIAIQDRAVNEVRVSVVMTRKHAEAFGKAVYEFLGAEFFTELYKQQQHQKK